MIPIFSESDPESVQKGNEPEPEPIPGWNRHHFRKRLRLRNRLQSVEPDPLPTPSNMRVCLTHSGNRWCKAHFSTQFNYKMFKFVFSVKPWDVANSTSGADSSVGADSGLEPLAPLTKSRSRNRCGKASKIRFRSRFRSRNHNTLTLYTICTDDKEWQGKRCPIWATVLHHHRRSGSNHSIEFYTWPGTSNWTWQGWWSWLLHTGTTLST